MQAPSLPGAALSQRYLYEDVFANPHPFDATDPLGSQGSSTPSTTSPQTRGPTTSSIVRNAVLINNVQSQTALQRAVHSFSQSFRLRGQMFTVETILSPLIYNSAPLKHAIFANFALQAEQEKGTPTSPNAPRELETLHSRYYNAAITLLQTTLSNPMSSDANVGVSIFLAFYSLSQGDPEHFVTHLRGAAQQIRDRGKSIETHPLQLHTKFLYGLYMRLDTVASSAVGQPATLDPEIARIVYSGVPISNKILLPYRIQLELLLAEISVFQHDCATYLPSDGWIDPQRKELLRQRYDDLVERLGRWQNGTSQLVSFEEAVGEYPHGSMLPPEMGLPLLCVVSNSPFPAHRRTIKNLRRWYVCIVLQSFTFIVLRRVTISFFISQAKLAPSPSSVVESSVEHPSSTLPNPRSQRYGTLALKKAKIGR
jgi:hypothetical protein